MFDEFLISDSLSIYYLFVGYIVSLMEFLDWMDFKALGCRIEFGFVLLVDYEIELRTNELTKSTSISISQNKDYKF